LRWLRILVAAPLIALAMPVAIISGLFSKGRKCSPAELADELQKFADSKEHEWDWDDLESVPLKDPRLEEIRLTAMKVALPLGAEDRAKLAELAERARTLT